MGWSGTGTFNLTYTWVNDAANGIPITASRMDTQEQDMAAAGFGNTVTRDGQGKMATNFLPDTDASYTLGSGSFQWTNLSLSGGISFGGGPSFSQTVAAWTPSDTSGAGLVFSSYNVNYTKQGNLVTVYGRIVYPVTANSAAVQIGGLPVAAVNNDFASSIPGHANDGSGSARQIKIIKNSTNFGVYNLSRSDVINSQLSGLTLIFNFTYPVS